MPFPRTREALEEAGFHRRCYTRCSGCNAAMEFWKTPTGKSLPFDPMPDGDSRAVSHFATCPVAERFRKAKK